MRNDDINLKINVKLLHHVINDVIRILQDKNNFKIS
jgi:hypothetical protein